MSEEELVDCMDCIYCNGTHVTDYEVDTWCDKENPQFNLVKEVGCSDFKSEEDQVIKMSEKRVFLSKYINESFSSNILHKEIEKSCSNCKNHTWDWDIDDGHYGDEYEVCLKNNDLDGPCEDYEEMQNPQTNTNMIT